VSRIIPHDHSNVHQGGKIRASTSIVGVDLTGPGGTSGAGVDDHLVDTIDAHDASAISILDAGSYTTTTEVESALQELYAQVSTVILQLTNKSGGSVAAGDVVVIDTTNDTAFTTTTSGQVEVSVGIAQATIASNAVGAVLVSGYAALVNVPSSMTRGRYLETHTVAKQATGSATRRAGSFGQFLTGGSTPSAWLWGQTDQTATGGSGAVATDTIWDAKGDLAVGTGANTAAVLTVGSNDTIPMADSSQTTGIKWVGSQTPSTQAFSDAAAEGTADTYARGDHKHGMPANPGGGGALVLLEQHTASSSATLDFTTFISSTYDEYIFDMINVQPATNATDLWLRFGTGGGPTYATADYNYADYRFVQTPGSASGGGTTQGQILVTNGIDRVSNDTKFGVSGTIRLFSPQSTAVYKFIRGDIVYANSSAVLEGTVLAGDWAQLTALTAARFLFSSGNIALGTIRVYGVAK
jgi:hypothetical protein